MTTVVTPAFRRKPRTGADFPRLLGPTGRHATCFSETVYYPSGGPLKKSAWFGLGTLVLLPEGES
jgi:hypothetical protein